MDREVLNECLFPKCKNTPTLRGLCRRCYDVASRMMREGKAKDFDLIARGLLLEKGRHTQPNQKADIFRLGSDVKGKAFREEVVPSPD